MLLHANRLDLELQSPEAVLAWLETLPAEVRSEVSASWIDQLKRSNGPNPWTCMFRILLKHNRFEIGSCGFKGPPDANGVVEIAYGIEESYRSQGFATEAVTSLLGYAKSIENVRLIRAHTKSEGVASERVLSKCGFKRKGQVLDPDDGMVNRWEKENENTNHNYKPNGFPRGT